MRYILILILFFGCITPKKVERYLKKNPEFNAKQSTEAFPVLHDTVISYHADSIYLPEIYREFITDTILLSDGEKIIYRPKIITKTVTITKESTAKDSLFKYQRLKDSAAMAKVISERDLLKKQIAIMQRPNMWFIGLILSFAAGIMVKKLKKRKK